MKLIGRIVYYLPQRKFGFIRTPDDREFFFHVSNFIKDGPALSLSVVFETAPAIREGKSDQAINIIPADKMAQDVLRSLASGAQVSTTPAEKKGEGGAL